MFGELHRGPKPPRREPYILLALSALIAVVLTLGYAGIVYLAERIQQAGQ